MIMEEQNINLEEMLVLKRSSCSGDPIMMLYVNEKGYLQMNQCMLREMKAQIPEMKMEVRYRKDYRVIAF